MTVLVDGLAVFRLTRLATRDDITEGLRFKVKRAAMNTDAKDSVVVKLNTLAECPWCASFWFACAVVAARRYAPVVWDPLARALAFSAVTGLLAENLD